MYVCGGVSCGCIMVLQLMNRLKAVKSLDAQQAALVDGAYYSARAPKGGYNAARRKRRPPMQVSTVERPLVMYGQPAYVCCVEDLARRALYVVYDSLL